MCGICALISTRAISNKQKHKFLNLLDATKMRGTDATGLAYHSDNSITVLRQAIPAGEFTRSLRQTQFEGRIVIGHCRLATKGLPENNLNNHPIPYHDFTLVHNGSCRNDDAVFKKFDMERFGEVDSEAIVALIHHFYQETKSVEEAIGKATAELTGSFACLLIHASNPDKLYAFKSSNPAYYIKGTRGLYIASTELLLSRVSGLSPTAITMNDLHVFTAAEGEVKLDVTRNHFKFKDDYVPYNNQHYTVSDRRCNRQSAGFHSSENRSNLAHEVVRITNRFQQAPLPFWNEGSIDYGDQDIPDDKDLTIFGYKYRNGIFS